MPNYEEANVKLTNSKLKKIKSSAKNKTGMTLRITKKNFQNEKSPHEIIQRNKIRNAFAKNMSTHIKLSKG